MRFEMPHHVRIGIMLVTGVVFRLLVFPFCCVGIVSLHAPIEFSRHAADAVGLAADVGRTEPASGQSSGMPTWLDEDDRASLACSFARSGDPAACAAVTPLHSLSRLKSQELLWFQLKSACRSWPLFNRSCITAFAARRPETIDP